MNGVGTVTFDTIRSNSQEQSFDESVSGMLFDYGCRQNVFNGSPLMQHYFGSGQTMLVNNLTEAESLGISDKFMNGLPFYHIKKFYEYVGGDAKLYLTFANCVNSQRSNFEIIENIQQAVGGTMFQLGIWTEQFIWNKNEYGRYGFTDLLSNIQSHIDNLAGKNNNSNESFPVSVVLCPNVSMPANSTSTIKDIDIDEIPEAIDLGFYGISVVLGQNGNDEVHAIQGKNLNMSPVGLLGYAMAILHSASAEMSIGSVYDFDLNKNEDFLSPELGFGYFSQNKKDYNPISKLNRVRQNILTGKGYIIPISYKANEGQVYFSNDQTLSDGMLNSISNNRIANKCKRIIRSVMLPKIKEHWYVDAMTGRMRDTEVAVITSEIMTKIDEFMINRKNQPQLYGRAVSIQTTDKILEKDEVEISCKLVPKSSSSEINFKDYYSSEE